MEYEFLDKVENNTTSQTYSEKHKNGDGRVRDLAWWPGDSRRLSKSLQQADEPYEDGQMMDRDQDQENELAMASIGEITSNMRMKKKIDVVSWNMRVRSYMYPFYVREFAF